jgi:hypothetical protein
MHILQHLRRRPIFVLGAGLLLMILLMILWPRRIELSAPAPPPLLIYPSAQEVSQATSDKKFRVCGDRGEEFEFHVRVTRFVTLDSLNIVQKFYYTSLVEHGPYRKTSGYGFSEIFEYDTKPKRPDFPLDSIYGFGVVVNITPGTKQTAVRIREYQYEKLSRACHLYNYYNDPWDL